MRTCCRRTAWYKNERPFQQTVWNSCMTSRARVNIHLPSQHNASHDNVIDRKQWGGGSIANINADGTFTHVDAEEGDDGY
jgi:hypothetical protein